MSTAAAIRDYLVRETDAMVGLLERFVGIETPSDVPESQQAMLDLLAAEFGSLGYRSVRLPPRRGYGGHLYASPRRVASRRGPIRHWQLLLGHCDTVRPLGTLESIYQKLTDEAAARRLEILEWIIVILIAVSIALPFVFIG